MTCNTLSEGYPLRDRLLCEFFLIRYVPDVVKGEFANIGVLLRETGTEANSMAVRFTRDWSRVRCLHPDADTELMEAMEGEIASLLRTESGGETKPILRLLEDSLSNSIQMSPGRACLAESLPAEMDQLLQLHVEPIRTAGSRKRTSRGSLTGALRREFERAGVWGAMRKAIAAAQYTTVGDPLQIDCGYRPNGVIRMFQTVSLAGNGEAAKVLAYSASRLREGVQRVEGAALHLTAIVEPLRSLLGEEAQEAEERYRFGVESMEREEIRVLTVNDLARVAETAKRELRL